MNEPTSAAPHQDMNLAPFAPSRRGVLTTLASGLIALVPFGLDIPGVEAKGGKGRKRKNKNKKKREQRGPETRPDATCPGPRDAAFIVNGGARLAQTFIASVSGTLVKAELVIDRPAGSSGDYLLSLSPVDNSGVPTNDVLAVALVVNASVPDKESTVDFTFPVPAAVEAGDQLALILTRLNGGSLTWSSRDGDLCGGLAFVGSPSPPAFELIEDADFMFTTFVRS